MKGWRIMPSQTSKDCQTSSSQCFSRCNIRAVNTDKGHTTAHLVPSSQQAFSQLVLVQLNAAQTRVEEIGDNADAQHSRSAFRHLASHWPLQLVNEIANERKRIPPYQRRLWEQSIRTLSTTGLWIFEVKLSTEGSGVSRFFVLLACWPRPRRASSPDRDAMMFPHFAPSA